MSFKAIDMSMAVHKNQDAAMIQRELQQKPQSDQAALSQAGVKAAESNRQRTVKLEETDKSQIRDRKRDRREAPQGNGKADKRSKSADVPEGRKPPDPDHPYKGHHIDLSL